MEEEICSICRNAIGENEKILTCDHIVCSFCLEDLFLGSGNCPDCEKSVLEMVSDTETNVGPKGPPGEFVIPDIGEWSRPLAHLPQLFALQKFEKDIKNYESDRQQYLLKMERLKYLSSKGYDCSKYVDDPPKRPELRSVKIEICQGIGLGFGRIEWEQQNYMTAEEIEQLFLPYRGVGSLRLCIR